MNLSTSQKKLAAGIGIGVGCALLFGFLLFQREVGVNDAFHRQHQQSITSAQTKGDRSSSAISFPMLETMEEWCFDRLMKLFATREKAPRIVVVVIDQWSMNYYRATRGSWPWNRKVWAELLEAMELANPRAVVFDLLFPAPRVEQLDRAENFAWKGENYKVGLGDGEFQAWLQELPNIVMAYNWSPVSDKDPARISLDQDEDPIAREFLKSEVRPTTVTEGEPDDLVCPISLRKPREIPFPFFWHRRHAYGWVEAEADPDGRLRRTALVRAVKGAPGRLFPSLALSAVMSTQTTGTDDTLITLASDGSVLRGGVPLARDRRGQYRIPYRNTFFRSFEIVRISRVLETIRRRAWHDRYDEAKEEDDKESLEELEAERAEQPHIKESEMIDFSVFRGNFVVIGTFASGVGDIYPTPFAPNEPGVIKHCSAIDGLLQGSFPKRAPLWLVACLVTILPLLAALAYTRCTSALQIEVAYLLIAAGYAVAAAQLFKAYRYQLESAIVELCLLMHFVLTLLFKYFVEDRQRRVVNKMFGKYMSPEIVKKLLANPELVRPGGQRRMLSAFFSDLANFTTLSETLPPEELVVLLNVYLDVMTQDVIRYFGYLDKYQGDGIMAVFGIHDADDGEAAVDHAMNACRAALANQRHMAELRERWVAEGKPPVSVRIGVNTGPMVAGNVGSEAKMNYTVIGDAVNLASRLEGANKHYNTDIMIGEDTYEAVKDKVYVRELDLLAVKGKTHGVRVYELLGIRDEDEIGGPTRELLDHYAAGLAAYRGREWSKAKELFLKGISASPEDGPCWTYVARCEDFEAKPPPANWDGVFRMRTK